MYALRMAGPGERTSAWVHIDVHEDQCTRADMRMLKNAARPYISRRHDGSGLSHSLAMHFCLPSARCLKAKLNQGLRNCLGFPFPAVTQRRKPKNAKRSGNKQDLCPKVFFHFLLAFESLVSCLARVRKYCFMSCLLWR